ncbi:MAG TPA: hypothetical protein VFW40_07820 [Capsulimonadaceae bacterium]|nr:hypothetical protein [Capsulimonadaceae bacterium]
MKQFVLIAIFILAASLSSAVAAGPPAKMSDALFTRAIKNSSTAPNYVLITVVNDNTGKQRDICTLATFLLGAIWKQYNIRPSKTADKHNQAADVERQLQSIALSHKDHVFHFSNPAALRNLGPGYTDEQLHRAQQMLKKVPSRYILDHEGSIYRECGLNRSHGGQAVLAYILIQRGLLPGMGDFAGNLYYEK